MRVDIDRENIVRVLAVVQPKKCAFLKNSPQHLPGIKTEIEQAINAFTEHVEVQGNFIDVGTRVQCQTPGDSIPLHTEDLRPMNIDGKQFFPFAIMVLFLNTTPYGSGSLEFPRQKQIIAPLEGTAVFFPKGWTHPYMQRPIQVSKWSVVASIYKEVK